MAKLVQNVLIRARRSGLSLSILALAALSLLGMAVVLSGHEGGLFTLGIGLAFLLGTATRGGPFHLRRLASAPMGRTLDRATLLARMTAADDHSGSAGQALCIVMRLDNYEDLPGRLGQRGIEQIRTQLHERLHGDIRNNDSLADLGAGSFAVYLPANPRIDLESAIQTALRLQTIPVRPLVVDGLRLHLSCSIGFCITARLPKGAGTPGLLSAAETALQMALRHTPRAIRAYDQTMQPPRIKAGTSGACGGLATALARGEILPWYQPQICTDTGRLTGLEALARWQHSNGTIMTPWQFLNDIHGESLSQRLTDVMIDAAITQLCDWDRAGIAVPRVSINLGVEDLADPTLVDRVKWALDRHSLPAARLGLEILETVVAAADPDAMASRNLLALGALGCHIDLDDFGTGSASINGIRRFGVHRIKIDRSLVASLDTDADQHAMIAAVLTMAQQLGVDVLAEGVETPGEFSALAQLGCAHVQGFAVARPMPAAELLAWMIRRNAGRTPGFPGGRAAKAAETRRRDTTL